jgi:hypothetical protein
MSSVTPPPVDHYLAIGDRIHIRQGGRAIPTLVGRVATVVEVFRVPVGSCLARIEGDPDRLREWFLYGDEVAIGEV